MSGVLNLVDHKSKESEEVLKEIQKWISKCIESPENIVSFGAILVLKDGSVDTYHECLQTKDRLSLMGGIEALKAEIIRDNFHFMDSN